MHAKVTIAIIILENYLLAYIWIIRVAIRTHDKRHACVDAIEPTFLLHNIDDTLANELPLVTSSGPTKKQPAARNINLHMLHFVRKLSIFFPSRAKKTQPL